MVIETSPLNPLKGTYKTRIVNANCQYLTTLSVLLYPLRNNKPIKKMTEIWYSPFEVWRFTKAQIIWLLEHLELLLEGIYPSEPKETGYIDSPGKRQINRHAPFETAAMIAAELELRLEACGQHGQMVKARHCYGWGNEQIALLAHRTEWYVNRSIKRTLWYITGGARRRCPYPRWVKCGLPRRKQCRECDKVP